MNRRDRARADVFGTTKGNAAFVRGHAIANAVPVVRVTDDRVQVAYEASIGRVAKQQLESMMARGLAEETAVDIVIRGMLGG